jgi:hypothetical protein
MKKVVKIILISAAIYLVINLFENLFYYSIGRHSNQDIKLEIPTTYDFIRIIFVTIFFALLQGWLTLKLEY